MHWERRFDIQCCFSLLEKRNLEKLDLRIDLLFLYRLKHGDSGSAVLVKDFDTGFFHTIGVFGGWLTTESHDRPYVYYASPLRPALQMIEQIYTKSSLQLVKAAICDPNHDVRLDQVSSHFEFHMGVWLDMKSRNTTLSLRNLKVWHCIITVHS